MKIHVEYKDTNGKISQQEHRLTRIAFAKHLAIAGQGYAPRIHKLVKTLAMFLHYSYYMHRHAFYDDRFSEPPIPLSDPTEKGQFSNLAGKAIADFISKRINKSLYTVNYEAAMRKKNMPLNILGQSVSRPDLLAFPKNSVFAIEAKGYSGSSGDMTKHKTQSQTGGIKVNFSVASVSYNLYKKVKCKYHDPINKDIPFDFDLLRDLTKEYYRGLEECLNQKFFRYNEFRFQNEDFLEVELTYPALEMVFPEGPPIRRHFWYLELLDYYRPRLILPGNIRELARNGISNETNPFEFEQNEQPSSFYIDNDRVGLRIR